MHKIVHKSIHSAAVGLVCVLAACGAQAQCGDKTGFAKQVCQAQAASSAAGVAGAADLAMKDFSGDPLTTSLSDVVHGDTLPPTIEPKAFEPLLKLGRASDGSFILKTGIFELYTESYSLEPYDQQWARPSGFFPAPIKGRRAKVISDILKYTELHPEVSQAIIQNLLGLTVYGTDFEKMPAQTQQAAVRILPKETLLLIKGTAQAKSLENKLLILLGNSHLKGIQKAAGAVAKAEQIDTNHEITSTLKELKTNSDAQQFTASGPRGTWIQMPGGYFLRYLPEGYVRTRVQVIVPEAAMEGVDPKKPLTFDPTQYLAVHAGTPAQRLGITLRPVGGR